MKFSADRFCKAVLSISPDAYAAGTTNGGEVDCLGFSEALVVLDVGDMETSATLDVKVQECATSGGTFADVTDAAFDQKVDGTDDNSISIGRIKLGPRMRYLRAVGVGATDAADYACSFVLLDPKDTADTSAGEFDV